MQIKRGTMQTGDFHRLIRSINPRLSVMRGDASKWMWGSVYHWENKWDEESLAEFRSQGNWNVVCPVSFPYMTERNIFMTDGVHKYKVGWREALANIQTRVPFKIPPHLGGRHVLQWGVRQRINEQGVLVAFP